MKIAYTAAAQADMRAIARYIHVDSPNHAKRFIRDLKGACAALVQAPRGYPVMRRFAELGLRKRVFRDYLIIYRVVGDIEVFRVLHGARDVDAVLGGEED